MNKVLDWQHLSENYLRVKDRVDRAAARGGRKSSDIHILVVTKMHSVDVLRAVIDAGITDLGENYVEEAVEKMRALGDGEGLHWHMIGHVQSRKARLVGEHFDYLHSLDSLKLAQRLDRILGEKNKKLPVLLQLNVSGEETKSGFPAWSEDALTLLFRDIEQIVALPNLVVNGLMTMPPFFDEPERARVFFRRLRVLRDDLAVRFPSVCWDELSMGMSGDFETAIEEGATWLRIGQAILGPRPG